ncbi:MAG TPA: ArsA family ATPase [Pyrinomonadaceae bacterium]|nr:ArsA family ATPase [Pyrinomonadaceae bacterium]
MSYSRKPGNNRSPLTSRYLFFGGKGGVGKTTSATATAFYLLENSKSNETILLFSTDPAHSIADSVGKPIGAKPIQIAKYGGAKLVGYEMDATAALERFRKNHGKTLAEIAERGTFLDEADINELLNLSLPGLDEVMALFELSELDREGAYDRIIVDTAPSGHTARLLRLPQVFSRMVSALDRMSDKHRYIIAHFARRRPVADEVDEFLKELNERIDRVSELLQNKEHTRFVLVTIPEALSVLETERYLSLLRKEDIPVTDLVINRVETEHDDCPFCRNRVAAQQSSLSQISEKFKDLQLHFVPLLPEEVRGKESLKGFGELVWNSSFRSKPVKQKSRTAINAKHAQAAHAKAEFPLDSHKIVIFGGKGGVGKTTAAASFALALAQKERRRRVLVFSTDPAHSLSDSFDEDVGQSRKKVAGISNLDAMEIDPGRWFEDLKNRYRAWTDELFASLAGSSKLEIKFDREAMRELVELTPPGIDEIAALSSVSDLLDQQDYDTIVLDTAPTGHLIRFLELPQVALSWVRTFIKLLLKYQHIVHATRIAEELIALSKSIKRVLALLTDTNACEFIGVAIPERMSLEETVDLSKSLERLRVPMQRLLINGLVPEEPGEGCSFCRSRRRQQSAVIDEFRRRLKTELFIAPQQPHPIQGPKRLLHHLAAWKPIGVGSKTLRSGRSKVKNGRRFKSDE